MTRSTDIGYGLQRIKRALRQRRRWRLLVRALWLALAVLSLGLLLTLVGLKLDARLLYGLPALVFVCGAVYAWISHPTTLQLAHGLDHHYELSQQLATALEVERRAHDNPLEDRLLLETQALLARMWRYFSRQPLVPWREVETLAATAMIAGGLWFAARPLLPQASQPVGLPDLPPPQAAAAKPSPSPSDQAVKEEPTIPPEQQQAADAIADALRDNGATSSAAEQLDRGNTAGAAQELRGLADQADQLSEQARKDLAQGLRDAAEQLREGRPDLSDQLQQEADAIEQGGQQAQQGLEDLARTVEQLGQPGDQQAAQPQPSGAAGSEAQGEQGGSETQGDQGQPNGQGGDAGNGLGGEQRGAQPGEQPQAQGDELPLPPSDKTDGPTTNATGPKGPQIELGAGGTGNTGGGGGGGSNQRIEAEADPLTIPPEDRDVVEDYFTPSN